MSFLEKFLKEEQDKQVNSSEEQASETTSEVRDFIPPLSEDTRKFLQERIVERMREIYDPEIPVDIYEMGLIYEVNVGEDANVDIIMTLTTPHCPVAETMPGDVQLQAGDVDGVRDVTVDLVWDPPWTIYMMSEAARLEMGFM
ncbi:MAG: DUF59 domain-containing protein [Emcibacter sp.]|nr:DUF59 domain-containing protein [Emcibacter sp.]